MSEEFLFSRALLIEDDSSHAFLISRALSRYCKEIVHARTLGEGKEFARARVLDLIITDLNLPDSSRALSVKAIREISTETPIIALTSSSLLQDAVEAMKHGASDFIVKDFGPDFSDIIGLALTRVASAQILRNERARLQAEMHALRSAIENGADGMAVGSSEGGFTYWNHAFSDFVQACGGVCSSISQIFGDRVVKSDQMKANLLSKVSELALGSAWATEISLNDSENTRTYEINLSIVEGLKGRATVLWVKDISSVKRREKFQRDMLATTTHDLKNPLAAISVSAELLTSMVETNQRAKDIILRVASSAQSAINLIDEFLSARRIREGSFILKPHEVSPVDAIDEELTNFKNTVAARGQTLSLESSLAPKVWKMDKLGIQRVLTNLVSNAVKFTPKNGEIIVRISENSGELHITVKDSGSGMEPAEVQTIFERYSRLERHTEVVGSGLGLFVVKSIVGAHGGRIDVTSQLGKGTTFEVILPKEPPVNERGELISLDFTA